MENNQIEYFGMFFTSHCTFETNIYDKEESLFHWYHERTLNKNMENSMLNVNFIDFISSKFI